MTSVVADTHTLIWYLTQPKRLSLDALRALDEAVESGNLIYISVISFVEFIYLVERGRLPVAFLERIRGLSLAPDSTVEVVALNTEIANVVQDIPGDIVREMPDRLIGATALYLGAPLVTRDHSLQATSLNTIW